MPTWVISTTAIALMQAAGLSAPVLNDTLATSRVIGQDTLIVHSYDQLATETLPGHYTSVLIDLERWQFTPLDEQQHPNRFEQLACNLAHDLKMKCITAPGLDLYSSPAAYLSAYAAGGAARDADMVVIQSQGLETDSLHFATFLAAAAEQAKDANPGVIVLGGLTTSGETGQTITDTQLIAAYAAGLPYVAGYWLNVPSGPNPYCPRCAPANPGIAVTLLNHIYN